ncbi:YIP1 family protein [Lacimicrobium sp. SS2-24]|uniref:YIP1 family protein n=1 Tax=Lacimicrobium sp. SS2-24 TaxID=2005569 RepID=UPI000B4B9543|nr:YIP1 family protein [Lacimicrobium sp. SS2-24]
MRDITNPLQACRDVLFRPNPVFARLASANNWSWVPFFLLVIISTLPAYAYFSSVDINWYQDMIINQTMADVSPAEKDVARSGMTRSNMITLTLLFAAIGMILVNAVLALYLNLMTRMDSENVHSYGDWYGMTWWVALPGVIGAVLSLLVISFSSTDQLPPEALNVTSLAYWLNLPMSSDWYSLLQSVRLESFWTIYLLAAGISQWTRIKSNNSWLIAAFPYLLVWSIWAISAAI